MIPTSPNTTPALSFGPCTELWVVEIYAAYAVYVARGVQVILLPRTTAAAATAKWLSTGVVSLERSLSLSSIRVN